MPPTTGSGAPAATEIGPPEIAGYQLGSVPVHQDGHTLTFEGRERASRRRVLVRVARSTADLAVVQRLRYEASVLRSLQHPTIVALHPGPVPIGANALMLEYVPGPSLAERMADPLLGALDGQQVCRMAGDVAEALDFAQEQGVIHGDVQPANILLPPRGPARLTGFGSDLPAGADARADVYGLAATVYFALTGASPAYAFPPAREEGGAGWLYTLTSASPFRSPALNRPDGAPATAASLDAYLVSPHERRSDLPPGAADVIRQGLAVRPEDRYASAGLFAAALQRAWDDGSPAPLAAPLSGRASRLRPLAIAGALALTGAGVWVGLGERPPAGPERLRVAGSPETARSSKSQRPRRPLHVKARAGRLVAALPRATSEALDALSAAGSFPNEPDAGMPSAEAPRISRRSLPPVTTGTRPHRVTHLAHHRAAPPKVPTLTGVVSEMAWLKVSARQAVNGLARQPLVADVRADRIYLDNRPLAALAGGDWVLVPPGPHQIAFYPPTGGPFAPNLNLHVDLEPRSRRHIQVPLPRRVADDTVIGGLDHFGTAVGIIKPGPRGGHTHGDDTDNPTKKPEAASPRHSSL